MFTSLRHATALMFSLALFAMASLPSAMAQERLLLETESKQIGNRVREFYLKDQIAKSLPASDEERRMLLADAQKFGERAAQLHLELKHSNPAENKQAYAAKLVELSCLMLGRNQNDLVHKVEYQPDDPDEDANQKTFGYFASNSRVIRSPTVPNALPGGVARGNRYLTGVRKIVITDTGLKGTLNVQLQTALHEVVHAMDFEDHLQKFNGHTAEELTLHMNKFHARRWSDSGKITDETRTERRAIKRMNAILMDKADEFYIKNQEAQFVMASIRDICRGGRYEFVRHGKNTANHLSKQQQTRQTLNLKENDPAGNHQRSINGQPCYGGIILGATCASAPKCLDMKFVPLDDNNWQLVFTIEADGKRREVRYDQFVIDDLWAAYHIVRPDAWMKKEFDVWNQECNLVHCEQEQSGMNSVLHPALAVSTIGNSCVALEAASGEIFLKDSKKQFGSDLKIALQWFDAPHRIQIEKDHLRVQPADDPTGMLLRLRLIGSSEKFLEDREAIPSALDSETKMHTALLDIIRNYQQQHRGWITPEQFNMELNKLAQQSLLKSFKDLDVDQAAAARAVLQSTPDLIFVNDFARTLAILNWAANELGDRFPAWPQQAKVWHCSVNERVTERRIGELCRLPHADIDPLDIPERQRAKGNEQWYNLLHAGRKVGWAQGFYGPITLGDGEVQNKRSLKVVLYVRRLNASAVMVRETTTHTDANGMLLRTQVASGESEKDPRLKVQASCGQRSLYLAVFKNGVNVASHLPASQWQREDVLYDSTYLALSGRGSQLAAGQSESFKAVDVDSIGGYSLPSITITRLEGPADTFSYKMPTGTTTLTWDKAGFPEQIASFGLDLQLQATTEAAALELSNLRPHLIAESGGVCPVQPALASVEGTVRLKIHTRSAGSFPSEDDPEWNVIERSSDSVLVENTMPLTHELTGLRRLATDKPSMTRKWLRPSRLCDSDHEKIREFASQACSQARATTELEKCSALRLAVVGHIQGNYSELSMASASDILADPVGDCRHNAILLTALLRSQRIPARMVGGYVMFTNDTYAYGHMWVEAFVDDCWRRLDSALYGATSQAVYVREGVFADLDEKLVDLDIAKIEVLPVDRPPQALVSRQIQLTEEQSHLAARCAFVLGSTKLGLLFSTLQDENVSRDAWIPASKWAESIGVTTTSNFPCKELAASAEVTQALTNLNVILTSFEQASGVERQSWEHRFGSQASASYALPADCMACLILRSSPAFAELLPQARKQLEADMKAARMSLKTRNKLLQATLLAEPNEAMKQIEELLGEHFQAKDADAASAFADLTSIVTSQAPSK